MNNKNIVISEFLFFLLLPKIILNLAGTNPPLLFATKFGGRISHFWWTSFVYDSTIDTLECRPF